MSLPILALFSRALRADCRSRRAYHTRLGLAVLSFFALMGAGGSGRLAAPGLSLFLPIVSLNFLFISLTGILDLAAVITEEKEAETLGLLQMAGLSRAAILLGKSTSRLVGVVKLLLIQLPFTILAATLGGVSAAQILAAYALLVAYAVFLSNLALFCSVVARRTAHAALLTAIALVVFLEGGHLGLATLGAAAPGRWLAQALASLSAYRRIDVIMRPGFAGHPLSVQVVGNLGLGLAFFLVAWATFDRFTGAGAWSGALPGRGAALRRRLGCGRPARGGAIAWKDFHFLTGGRLAFVARFAIATLAAGILAAQDAAVYGASSVSGGLVGYRLAFVSVVFAAIEFLVHTHRMFRQEINGHTLPQLVLLPIPTVRIILQKVSGVLRALVPYAVCALLGALMSVGLVVWRVLSTGAVYMWWFISLNYLLLALLVAYRAVGGRTGGAIGIFLLWFLSNIMVAIFAIPFGESWPVAYFVGASVLLLFFAIGILGNVADRLERLAGQ